jgi:hypothetical protein
MFLRRWDGESYCVQLCGRPAIVEMPLGMAGPVPVTELWCLYCAEAATGSPEPR